MVDMVISDGVRFRPEDAPKSAVRVEEKRAPTPKNKARTPRNKKVTDGDAAPAAD